MATVAEVMNKSVVTVDPTASIGEAAEKMIDAGVGAVVVMEDMARIVGIVTERDLMRAVSQRARAAEAKVRQWMTESVVTIEPDTAIKDAAKMMFERNFRHLPVVNNEGRLMGIASLRRLSQHEFEHSK
jgi:CBS domain-containing protein